MRRRSARHWEELNERGPLLRGALPRAPGPLRGAVQWEPRELFGSPPSEPAEPPAARRRATRAATVARAANQVKFTVTLIAGDEDASTQVVWASTRRPSSRGLVGDLHRLAERPFAPCASAASP